MRNLTVGLAQVGSGPQSSENLKVAEQYADVASHRGVELLVFPEVFMNHYPAETAIREIETQPITGPFVEGMRELALQKHVWTVFGMRETTTDGTERALNTTLILDGQGEIRGVYRKTHLYDAFGAKESQKIQPGTELFKPIASPWGNLGLFVCYELRFPEVARFQVGQGADILIVPSGWVRGPMKEYHWETLVVTRALENTAFVLACDQVSDFYCGRSLVVDPMGVKVACGGETEELITTTIDLERIANVREKLPSYSHRRPELYLN